MPDTARHTIYKTRLLEHVQTVLKEHLNTRKTEYGYKKL